MAVEVWAVGRLLEQSDMVRDRVDRVGRDRARGRRRRRADAGEARVAAAQQAVDGRLQVGEWEGEQVGKLAGEGSRCAGRPRQAVGASVAPGER